MVSSMIAAVAEHKTGDTKQGHGRVSHWLGMSCVLSHSLVGQLSWPKSTHAAEGPTCCSETDRCSLDRCDPIKSHAICACACVCALLAAEHHNTPRSLHAPDTMSPLLALSALTARALLTLACVMTSSMSLASTPDSSTSSPSSSSTV